MGPDRFCNEVPARPSRAVVHRCHAGHVHTTTGIWTRRRFIQTTAGVVAGAAATAAGLLRPGVASATGPGIGLAEPIPATLEFFPGAFGHVQAPPLTGVGTDPSTVTNFQGAAGIAFISGSVERKDRRTGATRTLPFLFTDMRFMKGVFRGRDGRERDATFAFI